GAGGTIATLDNRGQNGTADALVTTHHGDVNPGGQLTIRRLKAVDVGGRDQQRQDCQIRRGMLQEFPQWGHFALTCSRSFCALRARHQIALRTGEGVDDQTYDSGEHHEDHPHDGVVHAVASGQFGAWPERLPGKPRPGEEWPSAADTIKKELWNATCKDEPFSS